MANKVKMTAIDTSYSTKYGLLERGQTYEIDEADVSELETTDMVRGEKMVEKPLNKSAAAPLNKAETVPQERRRKAIVENPAPTKEVVPGPGDGAPLEPMVPSDPSVTTPSKGA